MSNLTPERRLDKNGKLVTRHVKAGVSASSKKIIPSVATLSERKAAALKAQRKQERETQNLIDALCELREVGIDVMSSATAQNSIDHLIKKHPQTWSSLIEHLGSASSAERVLWQHHLSNKDAYPHNDEDDTDYSVPYKEGVELYPLASFIAENASGDSYMYKILASALVSQARSVAIEERKLSDYESIRTDYEWIRALMLVGGSSKGIANLNLKERSQDIEYVMNNREAIEPHLKSLVERREWSKVFVESVIRSESPAISDGIL